QARATGSTSHVVECFASNGARIDTGFSILSSSRWADARATVILNGATPQVTVGATPGSTSLPTVSRSSAGRYTVSFPGMTGALGNVIVSPVQGSGLPTNCNVMGWGATSVSVACVQGSVATDASFSVLGARRDPLEKRSDMF